MTGFDIYIFVLCFIVFTVFVVLFTYMIWMITRMSLKLMKHGLSDEEITKEYVKEQEASPVVDWLCKGLSLLLCLVFGVVFVFSLWMNATEDRPANGIPSIKVVKSDSMATKHEANTYLVENNLNDQLQVFDVVVCNHLPAEGDLELYDIVVYEKNDIYVIHRIVGIEEPNEQHPNERHFLIKGDANKYADEFPVLYSQMKGIYEGFRIPFVGSFVLFMQSPAGWLVILLVIYAMMATPIVEKKMRQVRNQRLMEIGVIVPEPEELETEKLMVQMAEVTTEAIVEEPLEQIAEQVENVPEETAEQITAETEATSEKEEASV